MAKDVTNSGVDVEMAECEEDKVVTMMDVLQEQEDFEENANAVLGASDDKNCTYSKGYIKRQALYACMTCCSEAKSDHTKRAGLCLACSLVCHENHELVELYTKRNFRCDCGNSKFNSHPCQLTPNKALQNEDNNYNQNFSGLYCVCQKPYPDPENMVEDEMIQCTICEDWLHASHLETTVPAIDQYTEMICKGCMEKNVFLHSYSNLVVNIDNTDVDIININENDDKSSSICNGEVKIDKTDDSENMDMSEKLPETSHTKDETENSQNIESNIVEPEMTNNHDSKDNKGSNLNEKETLNESAEALSNCPMTSDTTIKLSSEMSESKNVENIQDQTTNCKNTEVIKIKKDESHSDNIIEQNISDDQPKETLKSDSVNESNEIVDNKAEVTSQEKDTIPETVATIISSNKATEDSNSITEESISNQNKKDEESMEEDRLLADPEIEDSNSKSNLDDEKKDDTKTTHIIENTSSDGQIAESESSTSKQDVDNKTLSLPNNDENESSNSNNSEKNVKNKNLSQPNNDKEQSSKLENEVSQDPLNSPEKATNSGYQKVDNKELSKENETNNKESESKAESQIENNITATTSNVESGSTEQSTSNACKESKPNSQDKVTEKRKLSTEESSNNLVVKKTKLEELNNFKSCICPKNVKKLQKGATFWPSNFRQKLCTCRECLTLYKDLSVLFLIDPEDTVSAYESLGIEKTNGKPSQYEKGLEALSSLDRIQQINALTEYNKMRDKLLDFLKSFKDRKEIVKEEDIKAFFAGMKPTREPDGVYFCR